MPDTKVSDETSATALTGAELSRIVQGGSSKKTTTAVLGHQFRGARAQMTADDTTVNATGGYTLSFDAASIDTDSFWSAGAPTRLTIPAGLGITHVMVTAQVYISSTTADTWKTLQISHFNSSDVLQARFGFRSVEWGSNLAQLSTSSGPVAVSDGDYFSAAVVEESDNSVTIEGDDTQLTFLALTVLGMEPV